MEKQTVSQQLSAKTRREVALALGIDEPTLEAALDNDRDALAKWFRVHAKAYPKIAPRDAENEGLAMARVHKLLEVHGPSRPREDIVDILIISGFSLRTIREALRRLVDDHEVGLGWDGKIAIGQDRC